MDTTSMTSTMTKSPNSDKEVNMKKNQQTSLISSNVPLLKVNNSEDPPRLSPRSSGDEGQQPPPIPPKKQLQESGL